MKIALISSCKDLDFRKYIGSSCTEIVTNIPNLECFIRELPVIYKEDIDELINDADWVTVICGKRLRGPSAVISKCRKYHVSFEIINIDALPR